MSEKLSMQEALHLLRNNKALNEAFEDIKDRMDAELRDCGFYDSDYIKWCDYDLDCLWNLWDDYCVDNNLLDIFDTSDPEVRKLFNELVAPYIDSAKKSSFERIAFKKAHSGVREYDPKFLGVSDLSKIVDNMLSDPNLPGIQNVSKEDLEPKSIYLSDKVSSADVKGDAKSLSITWGSFGFETKNGLFIYARENHNTSPAFIVCKDKEEMYQYIENEDPNSPDIESEDHLHLNEHYGKKTLSEESLNKGSAEKISFPLGYLHMTFIMDDSTDPEDRERVEHLKSYADIIQKIIAKHPAYAEQIKAETAAMWDEELTPEDFGYEYPYNENEIEVHLLDTINAGDNLAPTPEEEYAKYYRQTSFNRIVRW